jgi:dienelactone hydrolase
MNTKSILIILSLFLSIFVRAQNPKLCTAISQNTIRQFQEGKIDSVFSYLNDDMRGRLNKETLAQIWSQLQVSMGAFKGIGKPNGMKFETYYQIETQLRFEKQNLRYRLAFDKNNRISGMYFVPYHQAREPKMKMISNEFLQEIPIKVKSSGLTLPGTLTIPKGVKNFPIVVFVHGSGANDRDETLGPNKPFRDLAYGLAKMGVASIRYDKRSLVAPKTLSDLHGQSMLDVLVVNDALAAVALARTIEGINPKAVFVLGHSLGAMMAPRIAERNVNIKGIIMMAGNARPLEDLVYNQYKYLYNKDGLSKAEKQDLRNIRKKVCNVKHLDKHLAKGEQVKLPLTNDVRFWQSVNDYDQIKTAQAIPQSTLILQGLRDYQVTPREYKIWQHKLHSKKNVSFKSYEKLNHLFLEGEGKSYPDEYEQQGNIPEYVISDIAQWIKTQ